VGGVFGYFFTKSFPEHGFLFSLAVFLCPGLSKKKSIKKGRTFIKEALPVNQ